MIQREIGQAVRGLPPRHTAPREDGIAQDLAIDGAGLVDTVVVGQDRCQLRHQQGVPSHRLVPQAPQDKPTPAAALAGIAES